MEIDNAGLLADVEELEQVRQRELSELPADSAGVFARRLAFRFWIRSSSSAWTRRATASGSTGGPAISPPIPFLAASIPLSAR